MTPLAERIHKLRTRIRKACEAAGRDPAAIELLPVSKRQPLALVLEAAELGFGRFGENYVQEGTLKALAAPDLQFVLIGPLQRNKARQALEHSREAHEHTRAITVGHGIAAFGHEDTAALAHELWQGRGCPEGSPQEDWFHAVEELRSRSFGG